MRLFGTLLPHFAFKTVLTEAPGDAMFSSHVSTLLIFEWFGFVNVIWRSRQKSREDDITKMSKDELLWFIRDMAIALSVSKNDIIVDANRVAVLGEIITLQRVIFYLMANNGVDTTDLAKVFFLARTQPDELEEYVEEYLDKLETKSNEV